MFHNLFSQFKLTYNDNIKVIVDKIKVDKVTDYVRYVHLKKNITNYYIMISVLLVVVNMLLNKDRNDK